MASESERFVCLINEIAELGSCNLDLQFSLAAERIRNVQTETCMEQLREQYSNLLADLKRKESNSNSKYKENYIDECQVCFNNYQSVYNLVCKHSICLGCLLGWYKTCVEQNVNMTCPACKYIFYNFTIEQVSDQVVQNMFCSLANYQSNIETLKSFKL